MYSIKGIKIEIKIKVSNIYLLFTTTGVVFFAATVEPGVFGINVLAPGGRGLTPNTKRN